ncbi:MAG: SurA N-terminal domain-containing protein [Nocardioidaceae bacterium]|nr:SurA N-terminal domain-containing protein [Nocardioidaceae bacterium]
MSTTRSRLVPTRTRRLRSLVVVAAASTMLLSGCAGTHLGVAAEVGDSTITMQTVDDTASDFCTGVRPQLGTGGNPAVASMGKLRTYVVQQLVARKLTDLIAADYGITPSSDYRTAVRSAELSASALPEDKRAGYAELQTTGNYVTDVIGAAATAELAKAGNANPSQDEVGKAFSALIDKYLNETDITIDPRFGLSSDLQAADNSVSFAVSSLAKQGLKAANDQAGTEDTTYANALPASLRCQK